MIKSFVQVCLPTSIGQKGMIYVVPAKRDQITCKIYLHKCNGQNGKINYVPSKCYQFTCTSMSA